MRIRDLPCDEWNRLHELPVLLQFMRPEDVRVLAIEKDGEILASVGMLKVTHLEGLWLTPGYRGNAGVGRALFREIHRDAAERGERWLIANSADDRMAGILDRLGAKRVPVETRVLAVREV